MKTVPIRKHFDAFLTRTEAKLPASVWKALASAESMPPSEQCASGAQVADGESLVVILTQSRFRLMTQYIRSLEDRVAQLEEGEVA